MKRVTSLVLLACVCLPLASCYSMKHKVGSGQQTGASNEERQWYILWGLVPLNTVDTQAMAGGAANYTIQTEMSPIDVLISLLTGWVTIYPRTMTVTK